MIGIITGIYCILKRATNRKI